MVVGYALGNRKDQEEDILVLGEDDNKVITYSKALDLVLATNSEEKKTFTYQRKESLAVPYSTIRVTKSCRTVGAREVLYRGIERPDNDSRVRSTLELWGFGSYIDYLYAVCELGFLEGLIPVIELGFLRPDEIKHLTEVAAVIRIPLSTMTDFSTKKRTEAFSKVKLRRQKNIEWSSKLKFPTSTGFVLGKGGLTNEQKDFVKTIKKLSDEYGMINEFIVDNFVASSKTRGMEAPTHREMLQAVNYVRSELQNDVPIVAPISKNINKINDFIKAGSTDLGRLFVEGIKDGNDIYNYDVNELFESLEKQGFRLQQRFPITKEFIRAEKYSKKLGQVFDSYRYKIKKEAQEKLKETKA